MHIQMLKRNTVIIFSVLKSFLHLAGLVNSPASEIAFRSTRSIEKKGNGGSESGTVDWVNNEYVKYPNQRNPHSETIDMKYSPFRHAHPVSDSPILRYSSDTDSHNDTSSPSPLLDANANPEVHQSFTFSTNTATRLPPSTSSHNLQVLNIFLLRFYLFVCYYDLLALIHCPKRISTPNEVTFRTIPIGE